MSCFNCCDIVEQPVSLTGDDIALLNATKPLNAESLDSFVNHMNELLFNNHPNNDPNNNLKKYVALGTMFMVNKHSKTNDLARKTLALIVSSNKLEEKKDLIFIALKPVTEQLKLQQSQHAQHAQGGSLRKKMPSLEKMKQCCEVLGLSITGNKKTLYKRLSHHFSN